MFLAVYVLCVSVQRSSLENI